MVSTQESELDGRGSNVKTLTKRIKIINQLPINFIFSRKKVEGAEILSSFFSHSLPPNPISFSPASLFLWDRRWLAAV